MITYTRDEIVSSSKTSKNFGEILEKLKSGKVEKIVVSKNNKLEAVILPIEEFEKIKQASEIIEHIEIFWLINERKNKKATIALDDLISEYDAELKE
ncbi:MAG TPA: type II toxin-antitoxin system prevent-host-death family antitoxin [Candidatus Humimicrobiaceae bacterium]|jgi:prevent-host-death family protein|nr:MAG: hypothetical protein A2V94_06200 [Candidatus Atribacteria bacterium RBG_16_35_8]